CIYKQTNQAVCDHRLLYRDIYVGEPGSIGDARMFNRSPLCNYILFRNDMFSRGEHLLADGAYTLTDKVIVPYIRDRNNTPRQNTHNTILSSVRSAVERSFALLKGKNRRLKTLPMKNLQYTNWHITSCFMLHNFILLNGEECDGLEPQEMAVADDEAHLEATMQEAQQLGAIKRENIAHLLHP
ncbi:Putative nuclease, partial [Frankliniella fusca]